VLQSLLQFLVGFLPYLFFFPLVLLFGFLIAEWVRDRYRAASADPEWGTPKDVPPSVSLYLRRNRTESYRQLKSFKPGNLFVATCRDREKRSSVSHDSVGKASS